MLIKCAFLSDYIKGILSTAQAEGGKPCGNFPLKANLVRRFAKKSSQRQFAKTRKPVSLTQCTIKQITIKNETKCGFTQLI